jgi:PAS domain S-box-containing protein
MDDVRVDAERVLVESHALLEAISASAPAGVGMVDTSFRFVRVNPKLAEINGLPAEAHLGRTPRELFPALPLDEIEAKWRHILDTGEPVLGFEFCGETPAAPGVARWWREDWYPVSCAGRIVGIGVIVTEITEEKRASELQRLLVGIVGHDLRNPLSVITTTVRLLLARERDPARAHSLQRIDRASRRIEALARDLLDYTKVTGGGGLRVAPRPADLLHVVQAAAEEARLAHPGAIIECTGEEIRGAWDPGRILQVVGNLLSNAAKYGDRGEPISARCSRSGADAVIQIHNRGAPIPPERIPHLFDGLSQFADAQAGQGGIGLGLFICREIVRAHRGTIAVTSQGSETTFEVRLPA